MNDISRSFTTIQIQSMAVFDPLAVRTYGSNPILLGFKVDVLFFFFNSIINRAEWNSIVNTVFLSKHHRLI